MLHWLPAPADFRAELRAAAARTDPAERMEKFAALSRHRLDFLQTIQLAYAVARQPLDGAQGFTRINLALLGSATVDHLIPGITVAGLRRRLLINSHVAPYGQYRQILLDRNSSLSDRRPDFVLFTLTAQQFMPPVPATATPALARDTVQGAVNQLKELWTLARERFGATIIQQNFLNTAEPLFGSFDRLAAGAPANLVERLNAELADAVSKQTGVLLLDIQRQVERAGLDRWFDEARWLQGKMEISPGMAPMYGELLARIIGAQRGLSKKCLVLDLDNTLWGGVVGDVGTEGIVLGEGTPIGEAHLAVQRYAKQLRDRGVVLAICSKNDPVIAESTFRDHPEMLLKRSDIAVFVANWQDKAANLIAIAEKLNIGLDSLVFLDDNPAERARIRESLPVVSVPELPDDATQFVRFLADSGDFEAIAFTAEDSERAKQYATNAARYALRDSAQSMDEFLKSLEMTVVYGPFRDIHLQRITQLVSKTNQFNLTTKRYSLQEIEEFSASKECLTLHFRLIDRFGDNGLVSAIILRPVSGEPGVLEVDTWIMSCRVFGRQLELEVMNLVVESARRRGIRALRGKYIRTPKNDVVSGLYASLGFAELGGRTAENAQTEWSVELENYNPATTFIRRESETLPAETGVV